MSNLATGLLQELPAGRRERIERWYLAETRNLAERPLFEDWVEERLMRAARRWLRSL